MESKLEQIVNYYGKELQTIVAIEEMAELTIVIASADRMLEDWEKENEID